MVDIINAIDLRQDVAMPLGYRTRHIGKLSQGEVGIYLNLTLRRERGVLPQFLHLCPVVSDFSACFAKHTNL